MDKTHVTRRAAVTLTHDEAASVANILRAYASMQWDAARRTKHSAVREAGETYGRAASDLEASIVRRMFVQDETEPDPETLIHPCIHAHYDCSTRYGGPCSDEQRSLAEARAAKARHTPKCKAARVESAIGDVLGPCVCRVSPVTR